jgi:DNA-binding phage protein
MSTLNANLFTQKGNFMTLSDVRERLKDSNLMAVSKAAGVHYNALYRLMNESTNPQYETVQKLISYLEATHG